MSSIANINVGGLVVSNIVVVTVKQMKIQTQIYEYMNAELQINHMEYR